MLAELWGTDDRRVLDLEQLVSERGQIRAPRTQSLIVIGKIANAPTPAQ